MINDNDDHALKQILSLVNKNTGVDYSHYKVQTIIRRISRRMKLHRINSMQQYLEFLTLQKEEVILLCEELLIHVTDFFRDTSVHSYLRDSFFRAMLTKKAADETVRVWVAGCATGEEAYSIAIAISEVQEELGSNVNVLIFATDVSASAIQKARSGEFSKKSISTISQERLALFFTKSKEGYHISKSVRDICIFAEHNVLNDPPFSQLDFISCRNLLIYLDDIAQQKVLLTFHYALNNDGYLMLGKAETVGSSLALFKQVHKQCKIYKRKNTTGQQHLPELFPRLRRTIPALTKINVNPIHKMSLPNKRLDDELNTLFLAHYTPASVVVNQDLEILHFRGETQPYLKNPPGKATLNLLKWVSPELAMELRIAMTSVISNGEVFQKGPLNRNTLEGESRISIAIRPFTPEGYERLFLIVFSASPALSFSTDPALLEKQPEDATLVENLKTELQHARGNFLTFVNEQEGLTGDLQTANEEIVAANEELQSLNEELETSKEEIESSNEELITSNQELISRNQLLNESHEYAKAIVETIHEPLIVLDTSLRIQSVNKAFIKKFGHSTDEAVGKFIYHIGNKQWGSQKLRRLLESTVKKDIHVYDFEFTASFPGIGERKMLINAGPIMQKSNGSQLILLAVHDITEKTILIQEQNKKLITAATENKHRNRELSDTVDERTTELMQANKLLEQSMQNLERTNAELKAFAFVSSHDLQEPLRKIRTFASLILDIDYPNLSETGKDYFQRIQASTIRMRRLIQDLITYSEVNTVQNFLKETDLTDIINEVVSDMDDIILEKKALIRIDVRGLVYVIPYQFRQLIQNLLSNALKFAAPDISPVITIKSRIIKNCKAHLPKTEDIVRSCCHISVRDNGIGFEEKYSQRIFAVFQKLHGKDEYTGSGIGLSIVKKIIQNHQGSVVAKSKPGKGASFHIYIPMMNT